MKYDDEKYRNVRTSHANANSIYDRQLSPFVLRVSPLRASGQGQTRSYTQNFTINCSNSRVL